MRLIIVPTAGNVVIDGKKEPAPACKLRLETAHTLVKKSDAKLAILGGRRVGFRKGEADVAFEWYKEHHPDTKEAIIIVAQDSYCTSPDMVAGAKRIEEYEEHNGVFFDDLTTTSHPDHCKLAIITLMECFSDIAERVFSIADSGEPAPYSAEQLRILRWVTSHDPRWERWQSWPLRMMARKRLQLD